MRRRRFLLRSKLAVHCRTAFLFTRRKRTLSMDGKLLFPSFHQCLGLVRRTRGAGNDLLHRDLHVCHPLSATYRIYAVPRLPALRSGTLPFYAPVLRAVVRKNDARISVPCCRRQNLVRKGNRASPVIK